MRRPVPRRWWRLGLAAAVAVGGVIAAPGTASAATTNPVLGGPCTVDDLGRRVPVVETAVVDPTITHFKSYYVTTGATGSQSIALTYIQAVTVTVIKTKEISAGFNIEALIKVNASGKVSFQTQTATATTNQTVSTITWNFTQPGYYGVYQGVRKVTGTLSTLHCSQYTAADGSIVGPVWVKRPGGEYTTYGFDEEGVVRCEDVVPANSIMRKAQLQLGCDLSAAARAKALSGAKAAAAKAPAGKPVAVPSIAEVAGVARPVTKPAAATPRSAAGGVSTLAAPAGYTCWGGWYRIDGTTAGRSLIMLGTDGGTTVKWANSDNIKHEQWQICSGPADAQGYVPSMFVNRQTGKCLATRESATMYNDGNVIEQRSCADVPAQQFRFFWGPAGTNKIGIQSVLTDHMWAPSSFSAGADLTLSAGGKQDGTGTFTLVYLG